MSNEEIIAKEAVRSGFYTKSEVEEILSDKKDLPFHTTAVWRDRFNMTPRKESRGWETRLWKDQNDTNNKDKKGGFYLAKSYLFHISQCEPLL